MERWKEAWAAGDRWELRCVRRVDRWKAGWEMGNRCMGVWVGDGRMLGQTDGVCVWMVGRMSQ